MIQMTTISGVGLLLNLNIALLQDELLAHDAFPDVLHVLDDGLEVRRGVVRACDENVVSDAGCGRSV